MILKQKSYNLVLRKTYREFQKISTKLSTHSEFSEYYLAQKVLRRIFKTHRFNHIFRTQL